MKRSIHDICLKDGVNNDGVGMAFQGRELVMIDQQ